MSIRSIPRELIPTKSKGVGSHFLHFCMIWSLFCTAGGKRVRHVRETARRQPLRNPLVSHRGLLSQSLRDAKLVRVTFSAPFQFLNIPAQLAELLPNDPLGFGFGGLMDFFIKHQEWTCQSVFSQASPRVSKNSSRSRSPTKMASRRSPRFITW